MVALIQSSKIDDMTFQITSRSPMPLVPPSLFGRSTRIAQGNCVGNVPDAHTCWTSHTNCSHRDRSGFISRSAIASQLFKWSVRIPEGPGALPQRNRRTASPISSGDGVSSATGAGGTSTGMGGPGGSSAVYSAIRSAVIACRSCQEGLWGRSPAWRVSKYFSVESQTLAEK